MRRSQAAVLLSLVAGCATYSVRRSALVPLPSPSARSGQPMHTPAQLSLFSPRVAELSRPTDGSGDTAGLYLPRVQVDGAARFRLARNFDIGVLWDQGSSDGATAVTPDQPRPKNRNTFGAGASAFYSGQIDPHMRIGVDVDLLRYSVPYIQYTTCATNCGGDTMTNITSGRRGVWVGSVGVVPSFKQGDLTFFTGITLRNHPTNTKGEVETFPDGSLDSYDQIRAGPINFIVSGGVEWAVTDRLSAMAQIFVPMNSNPVQYAPTLGLGMSVGLGHSDSGKR